MKLQSIRLPAIYRLALLLLGTVAVSDNLNAQSRYATSDNWKGYVHWIELYDEDNARIDPVENPRPYSPEKTCGRCHDFKSISHGWHFNGPLTGAVAAEGSSAGRPGAPMIWSDARTGTYLPLSYRGWKGTYKPAELGISDWQVAARLGGFLPGFPEQTKPLDDSSSGEPDGEADRSRITGNLSIDCLLCHHRPGSGYSPFSWTEQIQEQNFKYAATAALGIAVVQGNLRRLKSDVDLTSDEVKEQLPQVVYDSSRFRSDGKLFIDLVRMPTNDACYYCHTSIDSHSVQGDRWLHDQDVHLRAGMLCADCHRNGLDHQTVRGFVGESVSSSAGTASLSCQGCHLGANSLGSTPTHGRLGAPRPLHQGLPPIHFEKLSCTACHGGAWPQAELSRWLTSSAHQLGSHVRRTGDELPAIYGDLILRVDQQGQRVKSQSADGTYTPHKLYWPSFWAILVDGRLKPLNPDAAYDLIRKPLKVRKDFAEELAEVKLTLAQRKQILGDERAARMKPEELNEAQRQLILDAESVERKRQIDERMLAAMKEIETAFPSAQAVYVDAGSGLTHDSNGQLVNLASEKLGDFAEPYAWPVAHAVRPAQQSLGISGCQECHGSQTAFFHAQVTPTAILPTQSSQSFAAHQLQHADLQRLENWNRLFEGRTLFKYFGFAALSLTCLIVVAKLAAAFNRQSVTR